MPRSPFTRDIDAAEQERALSEARRQAWCEDRNYAALFDALDDAAGIAGADDADPVSVPRWLLRGGAEVTLKWLNVATDGRKGPNAAWADRYAHDQRDLVVYEFVKRQRRAGLTRADAVAVATRFFRSTGGWSITEKSVEKMLERVADGLADEPGRYYSGGIQRRDDRGVSMTSKDLRLLVDQMKTDLDQRRTVKSNRIRAARRRASPRR